jgi:hypothetical protein
MPAEADQSETGADRTERTLRAMIPFRSHEQALDIGFKFRGLVACPLCGAQVGIYQRPNEWPLFVDPDNMRAHVTIAHNEDPAPEMPIDRKSAAAGER